jgi:hypothetical protein
MPRPGPASLTIETSNSDNSNKEENNKEVEKRRRGKKEEKKETGKEERKDKKDAKVSEKKEKKSKKDAKAEPKPEPDITRARLLNVENVDDFKKSLSPELQHKLTVPVEGGSTAGQRSRFAANDSSPEL